MFSNSLIKIFGVVTLLVFLGTGGYYVSKRVSLNSLRASVGSSLSQGNYLAALAAYNELKSSSPSEEGLQEKIAEAGRLLVAEENFKKAKEAGEREDWETARALLKESEALKNSFFSHYKEAKELYEVAEALAASAAHKTAVTIREYESKAVVEKAKREETEIARRTLEGTLKEKEKSLTAKQFEAAETGKRLVETEKAAEETKNQLTKEQARTKILLEAVANESRQKFINELRAYRDMAEKGKLQLQNAITEINGSRDVTALIYVSQGKILFEEARTKTAEFRGRAAPEYQSRVDELTKALDIFLEDAKQLRNAVVYIDDQKSANFTGSLSQAKTFIATSESVLAGVSWFIQSSN